MKQHSTLLAGISLLASSAFFISACSSTPEKAATVGAADGKVYYPQMSDSIAMTAIFKSRLMDTTYLGAGPQAGQIDEITAHWGWRAANLDSLKERYPKALLDQEIAGPIPVYYTIGNVRETEKKFDVAYTAALPDSPQFRGDLDDNKGAAQFLKNEKGWYLAGNVYNTLAAEQRKDVIRIKKTLEAPSGPQGTGLFNGVGDTKEFVGKVGNLEARYKLTLEDELVVKGSYYYTNRPGKVYTLQGKLLLDGTDLTLTEYTDDDDTAVCSLKLTDNCYTGVMHNKDATARSFKMTICAQASQLHTTSGKAAEATEHEQSTTTTLTNEEAHRALSAELCDCERADHRARMESLRFLNTEAGIASLRDTHDAIDLALGASSPNKLRPAADQTTTRKDDLGMRESTTGRSTGTGPNRAIAACKERAKSKPVYHAVKFDAYDEPNALSKANGKIEGNFYDSVVTPFIQAHVKAGKLKIGR